MELEDLLPSSQVLGTLFPYPELDATSQYLHSVSLRTILILYSYSRLCLSSDIFCSDFPTRIVMFFSSIL